MGNAFESVLEYQLLNGKIRIGKKELLFELLRKDSILRGLIGVDSGDIKSMISIAGSSEEEDTALLLDGREKRIQLDHDPTPELNELKQRYGDHIGGLLTFSLFYTTYKTVSYLQGNLDADPVVLEPIGSVK